MKTERLTPAQAKKLMQHGKDWDGRDVGRCYASEKLDGCRAYWDGAHLYTKEGNPIHAPHITDTLPAGLHLDGELYAGRGNFQTARMFTQYGINPDAVRFMVFDAPGINAEWPQRLADAKDAGADVVPWWVADGVEQLHQQLKTLLSVGAEGIMVRAPGYRYKSGRSPIIQKMKAHSLPLFEQFEGFLYAD